MITHYLQIPLFSTTKPSSKNFFTHIYLSSNNCHLHFDLLLKLELEAPAADLSMQQKQTLLQKKDLHPLNHRKSPARHMIAMKSLHMEKEKSPRIYEESIPDQTIFFFFFFPHVRPVIIGSLPTKTSLYPTTVHLITTTKENKKPYQLTQSKKQNKTNQKQQYEQRRITIQIRQRQRVSSREFPPETRRTRRRNTAAAAAATDFFSSS
jgi:hypothetical protein